MRRHGIMNYLAKLYATQWWRLLLPSSAFFEVIRFDGWFNLHCFHCGINGSLRCVMGNFVGNETHTTFRSVNSSSKEAEHTINIILMEWCCWQHLKKNLLVLQFHSLQELTKNFWRGSFLYEAFMPIWYVMSII